MFNSCLNLRCASRDKASNTCFDCCLDFRPRLEDFISHRLPQRTESLHKEGASSIKTLYDSRVFMRAAVQMIMSVVDDTQTAQKVTPWVPSFHDPIPCPTVVFYKICAIL